MTDELRGSTASPISKAKRRVFARVSIVSGNILQASGIVAACVLLRTARSVHAGAVASASMLAAWILLYFSCHAIAHWLVGRMVGIRFAHYTVGGTGNPDGWPRGVRWIFEHLPFFGVQTERASMQRASPRAKAVMWSAGVSSSAIVPALGIGWAWKSEVAGGGLFFAFAMAWALGTFASNWRSETGDYAKARRALGKAKTSPASPSSPGGDKMRE